MWAEIRAVLGLGSVPKLGSETPEHHEGLGFALGQKFGAINSVRARFRVTKAWPRSRAVTDLLGFPRFAVRN